jgi:1-phosphofructokinase family hexose kinase
MILTVTLNPLLEKRYVLQELVAGKVNKADEEYFYAGGKGINVSRQLNNLEIENQALLFAGGSNGKHLRKCLADEGINFSIVNTTAETRSAAVVQDKANNKLTSVFGKNSQISSKEVNEFKSRLGKMITNCSIIILSGSSPCEEANEIYPHAIRVATEHDKIVLLDSYGEHLKSCFEERPMMIHNNVDELENTFGIELKTDEQKKKYLHQLHNEGIKLAFITDGKKPTFAMKFGFVYKIINPTIDELDATGSGDAFTTGIAYGLDKSLVFDEFVSVASALGCANALRWDACNLSKDDYNAFVDKIEIQPIGKKMKLIDDSPTI